MTRITELPTDSTINQGDALPLVDITNNVTKQATIAQLGAAIGVTDSTTSSKGIVQLAGDLGGTAASPTTPTAVHLTGNETITGSKTFSATTNLTNVNMQGNITGTAQKKIILTANDATGSVSRLVEYHATNIVDRPWQSWFDQNNRQVVASGAHDTLPASEGGNQLKQFEIKTVADATGSNPTELRTRFAIQYDVQRGTWGVNYIDNFEINQGENPILTTPGSATQFGLKLRTAPQDTIGGTVPNAVIGTFTAQLDASDNAFGFLDIMPPYQSGGTLFPGNKTATLNIFRNTNSASSSSPVIAIKKGDGTNTTNITLNAKQGSITTVGAINGVGLDAGSQKITSVATPTISTDAATKDYVDTARRNKRVLALSANSATPAINTDSYDVVHITAQTAAITSFTSGLTGTPVDGDQLRISVTGTASVALTWGTSFESSTATLPTTTSGTTRLDVGFFWNTETSKWRCVAVA